MSVGSHEMHVFLLGFPLILQARGQPAAVIDAPLQSAHFPLF
jgi:hypothetical protein